MVAPNQKSLHKSSTIRYCTPNQFICKKRSKTTHLLRTPIAIGGDAPSGCATGQGEKRKDSIPLGSESEGDQTLTHTRRGTTAHAVDAKNEENEPHSAPMTMNDSVIKVFIVSSASDHYFTDKTLFKKYTSLPQATTGLCAGKGSTLISWAREPSNLALQQMESAGTSPSTTYCILHH